MNAQARRAAIYEVLRQAKQPVSATALAKQFSVSRQVIVSDVALMRAAGSDIYATPRGYTVTREIGGIVRQIACQHGPEAMRDELNAMVDNGCTVLDVIVEYPIYGQFTGPLQISNRYEVEQFIDHCSKSDAQSLSRLTEGTHLHTLSCPDEEAFARVRAALEQLDILMKN